MTILNKYKKWQTVARLILDKYFDFVLSKDTTPSVPVNSKMVEKCLVSYIDITKPECITESGLVSTSEYTYENCLNNGAVLKDIGYTGVDNGLIHYDKGRISNKDFYDLFVNSELNVTSGDCTLHLYEVTGNTGEHTYETEHIFDEKGNSQYYALKGGFFQGFYKLFGFDYEVLPQYIENEWNIEITLRPRNYETNSNTLNKTHKDTDGFFFYIGTRAENKFMQVYNADYSMFPNRYDEYDYRNKLCLMADTYFVTDDYYDSYYNDSLEYYEDKYCDYLDQIYGDDVCDKSSNKKSMWIGNYFFNIYGYRETSDCSCPCKPTQQIDGCDTYKKDAYFIDDYAVGDEYDNSKYLNFCDDYMESSFNLNDMNFTTSNGRPINERGYKEIETDNKFLTYDRTCDGLKAPDDGENTTVIYTSVTRNFKENPFLLFNRTCTGYTTHSIDSYFENNPEEYDVLSDIKGNCFGLRITEDGKIGYRYIVKDCDAENGFSVIEEYSFPNIIKKEEWATINAKFVILNGGLDECMKPLGKRKMKIYIYVNGYLKFVSKELDEFNFTNLNDTKEKQEGVPFNISLGGGSQGLCDSVWFDYQTAFEKILPIEQNFAGTFIGDIKSFKFYTCPLQYNEIKSNYLFERSNNYNIISIYK